MHDDGFPERKSAADLDEAIVRTTDFNGAAFQQAVLLLDENEVARLLTDDGRERDRK